MQKVSAIQTTASKRRFNFALTGEIAKFGQFLSKIPAGETDVYIDVKCVFSKIALYQRFWQPVSQNCNIATFQKRRKTPLKKTEKTGKFAI